MSTGNVDANNCEVSSHRKGDFSNHNKVSAGISGHFIICSFQCFHCAFSQEINRNKRDRVKSGTGTGTGILG